MIKTFESAAEGEKKLREYANEKYKDRPSRGARKFLGRVEFLMRSLNYNYKSYDPDALYKEHEKMLERVG